VVEAEDAAKRKTVLSNKTSSSRKSRYEVEPPPSPDPVHRTPTNGGDLLKVHMKPYDLAVWEQDSDLQHLRNIITPLFRTTWNFAMSSYLAGE
jgi:hypothetical protein